MSIASEISRLQSAKNTLKTKINAKNDTNHQIDDETLDEFGSFVDSIQVPDVQSALTTLNNELTNTLSYKDLGMEKSELVHLNNSTDDDIEKITVYGKTVQTGTPSVASPAEIKNIKGDNLFDGQFEKGNAYDTNSNRLRAKNPFLIKKDKSYTLSYVGTMSNLRMVINTSPTKDYNWSQHKYCGNEDIWTIAYNNTITFTATHSGYLSILLSYVNDAQISINDNIDYTNFKLEENSTATEFTPYNSVKIKKVNVNLWDEQSETGAYNTTTGAKDNTILNQLRNTNMIKCLPSTTYYAYIDDNDALNNITLLYYDADKTFISASNAIRNNEFTTPANTYYINFMISSNYGITYKDDICINLSNLLANGNYVAHSEQVYDFPLGDGFLCEGDYVTESGIYKTKRRFDLVVGNMDSNSDNYPRLENSSIYCTRFS